MLSDQLSTLPMFQCLTADQLAALEPLIEIIPLSTQQVIFNQDQQADYIYILISGEVIIQYKPYDGPVMVVARIQPGGIFGWSAALGRKTYTSAAVVTACGEACRISGDDLQHYCDEYREAGSVLLDCLASVIAERLRSTHEQVRSILRHGMELDGEMVRRIYHDGK